MSVTCDACKCPRGELAYYRPDGMGETFGLCRLCERTIRAADPRLGTLQRLFEFFGDELDRADAHADKPKGGQQVTPNGDFVYAQPSVRKRLRWWHREFLNALKGESNG